MRRSRKSRLIALAAASVIGMLGLLPVAHRHADDAGATVHRHATNLAGDHHHDADAVRHDGLVGPDHDALVRLLPDQYLAAAAFSLNAPMVAAFEIADPPTPRVTRRSDRANVLPTHDPPLRYFSSPAPPASL